MRVPCPYCKGTCRFRHERPAAISDQLWFQMIGKAPRCPLCKTLGYIERPMDHLMIDTGLMYVRNNEKRTLVCCPDPSCDKWADATEAFSAEGSLIDPKPKRVGDVPTKDFMAKCPNGHEIVVTIIPMRKG